MEENTEIQAAQAEAQEAAAPAETAAPQNTAEEIYKPRKNHRNKSGLNAKKEAANESAVCGEIADVSAFKEKLSGKHIEGYAGGEDSEERRPRRERFRREDSAENSEEPSEKHEGPSFEKPQFRPRAVEISLENSRPDFKKPEAKPDFVSYNSVEEPKIGFFKRIKNLFASLFKSGKKNGVKFKKNRKPDWKKNRKFSNSKDGFKKGGDYKNRKNFRPRNRRPDKGFKPRNANADKQQ
ncbi:MAG: hypothetical protein IKS15_04865 [Opitutales bacterium]|nr:hypothetical protein [Opitutales bacterium]